MSPGVVVMESLVGGESVIAPHNLINAVTMHIDPRRSPGVVSFLEEVPGVVMEVGSRVGVNVARVAHPAFHATPQRIVAKPGEPARWHVRTPDRDGLIERVVARGDPALRH